MEEKKKNSQIPKELETVVLEASSIGVGFVEGVTEWIEQKSLILAQDERWRRA